MSSVAELVQQVNSLLDAGILSRHDESFVTTTLRRFECGHPLREDEMSRLRHIVAVNN